MVGLVSLLNGWLSIFRSLPVRHHRTSQPVFANVPRFGTWLRRRFLRTRQVPVRHPPAFGPRPQSFRNERRRKCPLNSGLMRSTAQRISVRRYSMRKSSTADRAIWATRPTTEQLSVSPLAAVRERDCWTTLSTAMFLATRNSQPRKLPWDESGFQVSAFSQRQRELPGSHPRHPHPVALDDARIRRLLARILQEILTRHRRYFGSDGPEGYNELVGVRSCFGVSAVRMMFDCRMLRPVPYSPRRSRNLTPISEKIPQHPIPVSMTRVLGRIPAASRDAYLPNRPRAGPIKHQT